MLSLLATIFFDEPKAAMNNELTYKGFTAKIEFSADDNVFVGRLVGIDDIVMFDAETVEGLKDSMRESVDFYIEVNERDSNKSKKQFEELRF
jgi:predicted HicB family RNase H-like nuclease